MTENIQRRVAALQLLAATGMKRNNYEPPLQRLLWWLGINVPPPHFAPFWMNAIVSGVYFGITWGVVMWLIVWSRQNVSLAGAIAAASAAGVFFGTAMAGFYVHGKRKFNLPRWQDLQ